MAALISKPGISNSVAGLAVPQSWSASWFQSFITSYLSGADVRNAVGSGGLQISGNLTSPYATVGFSAPVTLPGPVTITAPSSGNSALIVNGVAGSYAEKIISPNTASQGFGLYIQAGTNSSDAAVNIVNAAQNLTLFVLYGDGHLYIPAQPSGAALTVASGALPHAWAGGTSYPTVQIGTGTGIFDDGGSGPFLLGNLYYNGSNYIYANTGAGAILVAIGSALEWYSAPSGTAGNSATITSQMVVETGLFELPQIGTGSGTELEWLSGGSVVRASSSRRYKTDIEPVTDAEAEKILQLRPVIYTERSSKARLYGLIAEEVYDVLPNLVHCDPEMIKGATLVKNKKVPAQFGEVRPESVHYKHLTALVLKVVQKQDARIRALEEKVR